MFKMCASNYALCFIGKILLFVNIQFIAAKIMENSKNRLQIEEKIEIKVPKTFHFFSKSFVCRRNFCYFCLDNSQEKTSNKRNILNST